MAGNNFTELEARIGYTFADIALRQRAFIHSSADVGENYERLEFLGDAVLELVISEYIFVNRPGFSEGEMTKARAAVVNETSLAAVARGLGLSDYIMLGRGEQNSGGADKPSILSDVVEALIGAVYIDGGFEAAQSMIHRLLQPSVAQVLQGGGLKDYKTRLQEHYHKQGTSDIIYTVYKEEGPPHNKTFHVKLFVDGREVSAGSGRSKKIAEQRAAQDAFLQAAQDNTDE